MNQCHGAQKSISGITVCLCVVVGVFFFAHTLTRDKGFSQTLNFSRCYFQLPLFGDNPSAFMFQQAVITFLSEIKCVLYWSDMALLFRFPRPAHHHTNVPSSPIGMSDCKKKSSYKHEKWREFTFFQFSN